MDPAEHGIKTTLPARGSHRRRAGKDAIGLGGRKDGAAVTFLCPHPDCYASVTEHLIRSLMHASVNEKMDRSGPRRVGDRR